MNREMSEAVRLALIKAAEAMQQQNKTGAFEWASKAARLAPDIEEPWLIMAAVSHPQASLYYLDQALKINPQSQKAMKGVVWAQKRLQADNAASQTVKIPSPPALPVSAIPVEKTQQLQINQVPPQPKPKTKWLNIVLFWVGLFVVFCTSSIAISAFASNWMVTNRISIIIPTSQLSEIHTYQTPTATLIPTITTTPTPVPTPTLKPSETPTFLPSPTSGMPTAPPVVPAIPVTAGPTQPERNSHSDSSPRYTPASGEKWIDVNLSQQKLYAYEGNNIVNTFLISSGVAAHPTVTGQYHIYVKYRFDDMQGPGYFLPNVPYVMYFLEGYGLHGTYWHSNFGHPMSHGCVNLSITDAEWMYNWTSIGNLVNIHY